MVKKHIHRTVPHRRKREGRTDYRKRFSMLKSGKPRVYFRIGSRDAIAQLIEYNQKGDKVLKTARASSLKAYDWFFTNPNIPTCYLFGFYFAKNCMKDGFKEAIFDTGIVVPKKGGRYFAFAKGLVDAGFNIPVSPEVFPSDERIRGVHIANYVKELKKEGEFNERFSMFVKNKQNPEDIEKQFDKTLKMLNSL